MAERNSARTVLPGETPQQAASLRPRRVSWEAVITALTILDALVDWEDVQRQREREQLQELEAVPVC